MVAIKNNKIQIGTETINVENKKVIEHKGQLLTVTEVISNEGKRIYHKFYAPTHWSVLLTISYLKEGEKDVLFDTPDYTFGCGGTNNGYSWAVISDAIATAHRVGHGICAKKGI